MTFTHRCRMLLALCFALAGLVSTLTTLPAAPLPDGWGVHKGKTLTIGVPPGFTVDDVSPSEVNFINEEEQIMFSVYVPAGSTPPKMMDVEVGEKLTEKESNTKGKVIETQMTMKGKNYIRFVVSLEEEGQDSTVCWGIRVPNMEEYKRVRPLYMEWKKTLTRRN